MRGTATALVTPFHKDGSIDNDCFTKLVGRQIKGGGLRVNDVAVTDEKMTLSSANLTAEGVIKLSLGKKRHVLLRAA